MYYVAAAVCWQAVFSLVFEFGVTSLTRSRLPKNWFVIYFVLPCVQYVVVWFAHDAVYVVFHLCLVRCLRVYLWRQLNVDHVFLFLNVLMVCWWSYDRCATCSTLSCLVNQSELKRMRMRLNVSASQDDVNVYQRFEGAINGWIEVDRQMSLLKVLSSGHVST